MTVDAKSTPAPPSLPVRLLRWLGAPPLPAAFCDALTLEVAGAERATRAEIIVAIRHCSGNYRDVDYLFGAAVVMLRLLYFVVVPWHVHEYRVLLELPLLFVISAWLCARLPLRPWLTTPRRRLRQVQTEAAACFVADNVVHTRERTGLLIYWSIQERRIQVLPDIGITAAVPGDCWNAWLFQLRQVPRAADPRTALRQAIGALGELLAQHLPAGPDNPDELPNRPRAAK